MTNVPVQYNGLVLDGQDTTALVTTPLTIPDDKTLAQVVAALGVWAAALQGVQDAAMTQVYATLNPPLPGGLNPATGSTWMASLAENTGIIDFSATGTGRRWGQAIPGFSMSLIVAGKVDVANAAIVALTDLLTNPTGFFTNDNLQSLEAALDALLAFRKRAFSRQVSTSIYA